MLWSNWFIEKNDKLADLTLAACGKGGHWELISYKPQIGTKGLNFNDSVAALKSEYIQADVISLSAALLLHAVKHPQAGRLYPNTFGWCKDPRIGTDLEKQDVCYGSGGPLALAVGFSNGNGFLSTGATRALSILLEVVLPSGTSELDTWSLGDWKNWIESDFCFWELEPGKRVKR